MAERTVEECFKDLATCVFVVVLSQNLVFCCAKIVVRLLVFVSDDVAEKHL